MVSIRILSVTIAFLAYSGRSSANVPLSDLSMDALSTTVNAVNQSSLEVTAIVGRNHHSIFQCWKIHPDFSFSQQKGLTGLVNQQLGNITNSRLIMSSTTSQSITGLHPAPAPQWVVFLSGGGYFILPQSGERFDFRAGNIIIANDTEAVSGVGHDTVLYPGTNTLFLPFANGIVDHSVILDDGPCT